MLVLKGQVEWGDVHIKFYVNARLDADHFQKPSTGSKTGNNMTISKVIVTNII